MTNYARKLPEFAVLSAGRPYQETRHEYSADVRFTFWGPTVIAVEFGIGIRSTELFPCRTDLL